MDTSLKENKLLSTTLGVFLITLILTVVSVVIYAPIKDAAFKNDAQQYLGSNRFNYTLADLTHYLAQTKIDHKDIYNSSYDDLENIKYYLQDQNNNLVASNMKDKSVETEIKNSRFYLHVKFDENGNPTIESAPNSFAKHEFLQVLTKYSQAPVTYLANLDIVYTVPEKLTGENDFFTENYKRFNFEQYMILIFVIGGISILVLMILTFAIPYSAQKQAAIAKFFNHIYLELKILIWMAFFFICFAVLSLVFNYNNNVFNFIEIIHDANWYFYLIGIPITFILYTLIYLSICYIKHIYYTGFKEGFIKNSLSGKLFIYISSSIKETVNQIIDVDITKDYNKKLFTLLGINLLVLIFIALTSVLGIILALAYTVLLFNYSLKSLNKVRTLNEASSQLAKGNFDIVLPEDMGVLSPFSKNLNNIKEGFKVAVEEEVKSQNMKTQLISNVSHDLKTPLTSIITYVDLLKNEDLEKETQKEYIDILDQKSKRLKVLIDDLFEASKASSGNIELHLEQVDIIALLRQTVGEMEEKIHESTLQMKSNLPESKIICELDGTRTYRVFENIIGNILKYSMPNSRVYIDVEEHEKSVSLIFKNISAYEMNFDPSEIMERFTRGDKSRNTEGSGLGLAIAKSLVELQNGSLDINIDGDLFKLTVTFPKA